MDLCPSSPKLRMVTLKEPKGTYAQNQTSLHHYLRIWWLMPRDVWWCCFYRFTHVSSDLCGEKLKFDEHFWNGFKPSIAYTGISVVFHREIQGTSMPCMNFLNMFRSGICQKTHGQVDVERIAVSAVSSHVFHLQKATGFLTINSRETTRPDSLLAWMKGWPNSRIAVTGKSTKWWFQNWMMIKPCLKKW